MIYHVPDGPVLTIVAAPSTPWVGLQMNVSMRPLFLVVGIAVLAIAVVDLLWTTLWVDGGAGPLSSRLATLTWRGLRTVSDRKSRLLGLAGPIILSLTLATWVALVWGGWTLVFASGEETLVDTRAMEPVTWTGRIYFVAYSMFTMGNGDFSPNGGVWQIATSFTTASGMLFVTFGVSYVISVLGAVVDKRSFASTVSGLGDSGQAIVRQAWNGEDFRDLDETLGTVSSNLDKLAEQHKAYPILHYYHSQGRDDAAAMSVAVVDEALTLLTFGVPEDRDANATLVKSTRASVDSYLETLQGAFIGSGDRTPPPPDIGALRAAAVPTVSDEAFEAALADLTERRRKLLALVSSDAWKWPPRTDE